MIGVPAMVVSTGHGFVYRDDDAHAIYYAGWSGAHPESGVTMAIAIGEWIEGSSPADRTSIGIKARSTSSAIEFSVLDADDSPWAYTPLFGQMLDREHALLHPRFTEVPHVAKRSARALYEQVTDLGTGEKEHRYYVHSPERVIAVVTRGGEEPGARYLHVDHLGSVDAITNETGEVIERRSYDAFGQRRNPSSGQPAPASFTGKTTKGFTGHEGDDEVGLVNMKGRVYDPRLGRFTTTDPIIAHLSRSAVPASPCRVQMSCVRRQRP